MPDLQSAGYLEPFSASEAPVSGSSSRCNKCHTLIISRNLVGGTPAGEGVRHAL